MYRIAYNALKLCGKFEHSRANRVGVIASSIFDLMSLNMR